MRTIGQYTVYIFGVVTLLCVSCAEDYHENTPVTIDSLKSLKSAFDNDIITHVDFKTIKQDNILNDEIISMELVYDEVRQFPYLKISSESETGEPHSATLTPDNSVTGSITEEMIFAPWVGTDTYINGKKMVVLSPYTIIFEPGITSSGLNILSDTLQIHFY